MNRRGVFAAVATVLLAAALAWPAADAAAAGGGDGQYELKYRTTRADGFTQGFSATALPEGKIVVAAGYIDGGCITSEALTVKAAGRGEDGVTVVELLLTLDGSACKAMFAGRLQAVIEPPAPGPYRVRLWLRQLYYGNAERLIGEQEVTVDGRRSAAEGFLGLAWGTKPEKMAGLSPMLWALPFDAYRVARLEAGEGFFGAAAAYVLVFAPGEGLVQGRVEVDTAKWPDGGRLEFMRWLGPQLVIEPAPGRAVLPTWHVGGNTRVVESGWGGKTVYIFSRRDFAGLPAIGDKPTE